MIPDHDHLAGLAASRDRRGPVFAGRLGTTYVADPALARTVLANTGGRYREHSDFFWTRRGVACTRQEQIDVGRALRDLLGDHVRGRAGELPDIVARRLVGVTTWPDAGNRLALDVFGPALLGGRPSPEFREVVTLVVERAVLAGARDRQRRVARLRLRARTRRVLTAELRRRRAEPAAPVDVLGALVTAAPAASDRDLAEVFLSCLFAVVGSLGFVLAWSVLLAGTSGTTSEPGWIVREALRLWPVAWLFARTPTTGHDLGGVPVRPGDEVLVCGYLVHRDPRHWPDPDGFRPERWARCPARADTADRGAFIPFGWGPHACTGAGLSLDFAQRVVGLVTCSRGARVTLLGERPQLAAALAPPRFLLALDEPLLGKAKGGEQWPS